jgi:hypothetical protein
MGFLFVRDAGRTASVIPWVGALAALLVLGQSIRGEFRPDGLFEGNPNPNAGLMVVASVYFLLRRRWVAPLVIASIMVSGSRIADRGAHRNGAAGRDAP